MVTEFITEIENPFNLEREEFQKRLQARREKLEALKEEHQEIVSLWIEKSVEDLELEDLEPEELQNPIHVLFPDVSTGIGGQNVRAWMEAFQQKMNDDFETYHDDEHRDDDGNQFQVPIRSYGTGVEGSDRRYLNSALTKPLDLSMVEEEHFCFGVIAPVPGASSYFGGSSIRMLSSVTRHIKNGGTLIFITPRSALPDNSTLLALYYQNLQAYALPDKDYEDENNLVLVIGTRTGRTFSDLQSRSEEIVKFAKDTTRTGLRTQFATRTYFKRTVIEGPENLPLFRPYLVDRNAAITEAEETGILPGSMWDNIVGLDETTDAFRPQNPLTMGHIGWMVSSGSTSERGLYLQKLDDDGIPVERQLFRGTAKKKEDVSHDYTENRETRMEKLDARAVSLNMDSWQWDTSVELSPFIQKWRTELADHMSEFMSPHFSPEKFGSLAHRYPELLRQPLPGIGQKLSIESITDAFSHENRVIMNGEPGLGKTFIAIAVTHMLGAKVIAVDSPIGIVWKWYREIVDTIPGAQVFVIGKEPPRDIPRLTDHRFPTLQLEQIRKTADPNRPLFIILPSSSSKLDYNHLPAVVWRYASKSQMPEYDDDDDGRYPVGAMSIRPHIYPENEEEVLVTAPSKVMCCPECLQPIEDGKGKPRTWNWLAEKRRTCVNTVRSEDYTASTRNKTLSRFDFGLNYGDGEINVTERQVENLLPILRHDDVKIINTEVFTNHVNIQYEVRVYKARECGSPLWQAKSRQPEIRERMAFQKAMAEYDADFIKEYKRDLSQPDMERPIGHLVEDVRIDQNYERNLTSKKVKGLNKPGILRTSLCRYIAKHMPGWIDFFIADELHTYSGEDSAQGESAGRLANIVPRSLGLTGTLMNGKSSNLFYTLWRFSSRIRRHYGYHEKSRWVKEHGFYKKEIAYKYSARPQNGRGQNNTHEARKVIDKWDRDEVPGIMPTALPYLLPNSTFMRLEDVVEGLPPFSEYNITVDLDERPNGILPPPVDDGEERVEIGFSQRQAYDHLQSSLKRAIRVMMNRNASEGAKMMATYLQSLLSYPDGCVNPNAGIVTDRNDNVIFEMLPMREDWIYPKEQELLDIVAREKAEGRKVLVYALHTKTRDVTERARQMLEDNGHYTKVLHAEKVKAERRIEWIEDKVEDGLDVLITHPKNVEMGHDLRWFPTIVWLEPDYQANRVRQASRRSWRIGQTQPVKIYYLNYNRTMQTRALQLVAQKVATSLAVEGELPTEGLAALSPSNSIEMELARTLVQDENLIDDDRTFTGLIQVAVQKNAENDELLIEGGQNAYVDALHAAGHNIVDEAVREMQGDDEDLPVTDATDFVDHTVLAPVIDDATSVTTVKVVKVEPSVTDWLQAFQMSEADLAKNGQSRRGRRRR